MEIYVISTVILLKWEPVDSQTYLFDKKLKTTGCGHVSNTLNSWWQKDIEK